MTVDLDSTKSYPVCRDASCISKEWNPLHSWSEVVCLVIASYLEVPTIFAEAERKDLLLNDVSIKHGIEDRLHMEVGVTLRHTKDPVSFL